MRNVKLVLIAALLATSCTDPAPDRSESTTEDNGPRETADRAQGTISSAPLEDAPPRGEPGDSTSSPSMATDPAVTRGAPSLSLTIPTALQGKWRRSTETSVTSAQCVETANGNMGLVLTIRPDGFSRFEEGGRLIRVHERESDRLRATFDTTYADTPTQGEFVFETQDNGQTLIERQYGDGAQPGILRYRRCPQG